MGRFKPGFTGGKPLPTPPKRGKAHTLFKNRGELISLGHVGPFPAGKKPPKKAGKICGVFLKKRRSLRVLLQQ